MSCVIRKLVPNADINRRMKFTKKSLIETLRILEQGGTAYRACKEAGVTVRRVNQIWKIYRETGKIPELGKNIGRPLRPIKKEEEKIIRESYAEYKACASELRKLIKRDINLDVPHYHIHKILLSLGFARLKEGRDVRKKKWIRYERRHSLTAVHLDWFETDDGTNALPIIDDASRKLLALIETKGTASTDVSIDGMRGAMEHGKIEQCISDHGTQFIKDESKRSRFTEFLQANGIKHILCRVKHPQSNGKVEKFGHLYKKHRKAFKTKEEFINWYSEVRPHMSLRQEILETPEMAYQRKKKEGRQYLT